MSSSILSLGTAVPPYKAKQADLAEFMTNYMGLDRNHSRRLQVLYNLSGIETRYSVIPDFTSPDSEFRFFPNHSSKQPPSTQQRMALYQEHAVQLGTEAAKDCLANFNGSPPEITHLIAVSCTGMYAPGLDIDLVKSLELPTDIERTAINFMGCYAAFNALKAADKIVQTSPESNVLIVAVELCTIHFQPSTEEDAMVSNALFADGAGAAIVGRADNGQASLSMDAFYSDLFLDGQEDMGWYI
ncbi:MAG: type III polyketide synthase, partial [Bacteroidota bacterium]